jgi:hypothetical protein
MLQLGWALQGTSGRREDFPTGACFFWAGLAWPLNGEMKAMVCLLCFCADWAQPCGWGPYLGGLRVFRWVIGDEPLFW